MPARLAVALALAVLSFGTSCKKPEPPPVAPAAHVEPAWRGWDAAAFAEAKSGRKIILVDVIASWCHWCHVMDEETYADPEVAALLAEHFIAIRVDSDARPDVAERYADWGWPATAFLTSDARPVLELRGYQDPREFAALLRRLVAEHEAGKLTGRVAVPAPPPRGGDLVDLRKLAAEQLDSYWDDAQAGWGRKQKYPLAANNEYSLLRAHLYQETAWQERGLLVLDRQRDLIDPVWGGMYQYSVHGVWTDPHFEKIAPIQAGALESYALAYRRTRDPRWKTAAGDIARYLLEFWVDGDDGGFYTSQDADLRVPTGRKEPVLGDKYYAMDDAARRALGLPVIDTHVYADRNGALVRGLLLFDAVAPDEAVRAAAVRAGERLLVTHRDERGGFRHAGDDRGLLHLGDQAEVGRGLLALYRTTGDPKWQQHARGVGEFALRELADPAGGFYAHTVDPEATGTFAERRKPFEDNARMARFLLELQRSLDHDADDLPYARAAELAVRAISQPDVVKAQARMLGDYLLALAELTITPIDITVVGRADEPAAQALLRAALAHDEPRANISLSAPGTRYPDLEKPAAYLCTDTACSTPITDPARFSAAAEAFLRGIARP
ncbi:DUF255 domain-containing protein [Nannocystis pusilla]|uniref:DUF255 domain-containing protein n=1 Tax=Nannocystis pusilla TaxID=889268 RepID=A0ABS7TX13_9BACT|nr:DUF255 domain-containing protein [Nannocystis pusilla]